MIGSALVLFVFAVVLGIFGFGVYMVEEGAHVLPEPGLAWVFWVPAIILAFSGLTLLFA